MTPVEVDRQPRRQPVAENTASDPGRRHGEEYGWNCSRSAVVQVIVSGTGPEAGAITTV